ncbi:MAG TPA: hypothetical protein VM120_09670 [Bryobacteraceae bacterium]|nr:hypothetical protein [Bryobacteraceae bacterium]
MPLDLNSQTIIRWNGAEPLPAAVLDQAGITAIKDSEIEIVPLTGLATSKTSAPIALTGGLWPGIRKPPTVAGRGDETASASREPWVDANGYQIGYLRALYLARPAVLAYAPDNLGDRAVPFDSLELALIEAFTAGGNYILTLEPNYRAALLRNDSKALAAWEQLGRTARWLRENVALFRQPTVPIVTALVEAGPATAEIANLLYRRNVSPALVSPALAASSAPPKPNPQQTLALVAANLRTPSPEQVKKILAHAEAGATVIAATPAAAQWWRVPGLKTIRSEKDREFYSLAKGQLVAYRRPISDPSEFALDVIDIITHKNRAVRLWNGPSVIALATASPQPAQRLVHLVNYGSPIDTDVQVRVQGHFAKAALLRPDASELTLPTAKRGTMTEVQVPALKRLGILKFS